MATRICFIQYTEYSRSPRIRRNAEALSELGYVVDCYVLGESDNNQIINNVNIIQSHVKQYRGNSFIKYIISYIKFFIWCFWKLSIRNLGQYRVINVINIPEFIIISIIVNKLFNTTIILDITDFMPELYSAKFRTNKPISKIIYNLFLLQEHIFCFFADHLLTVHKPAKLHMVNSHKLNKSKIKVITNLPDKNIFHINSMPKRKPEKILNFIYHGTISKRFDFETVLHAFSIIKSNNIKFKFNIYGKGEYVDELIDIINNYNLKNEVIYKGFYPLIKMPEEIKMADIGIVSYEKSDATELMLPLKLMEYLAMELPVITIKNKAIGYYFDDSHLFYYEYGNYNKLVDLITNIYSNYTLMDIKRVNCNKKLKYFNWDIEKKKYQTIITEIIN